MKDQRIAPALPEGRRAVVYALRRRGQATADDIARQLDMTVSGARQHLTALVDDGLAEATELPRPPGQRGRAQLAYMVTERADALFPKAYGERTSELDFIRAALPDADVDRVQHMVAGAPHCAYEVRARAA